MVIVELLPVILAGYYVNSQENYKRTVADNLVILYSHSISSP